MSVYAKQGTAAKFDMYCFFKPTIRGTRLSYTWDTHQIFTNGSDNGGAAPVSSGQEYVGNGWYRIWMEVVDSTLGTNTELEFRIYPASRDTGPTGSTLFWNPQVVKGSDPGRYIKTYGSAITAPTTFKNLSSSSYTGTLDGATFVNNYIDTGSSTGRLIVTDDGGLQEGNNFSYEAWVWYDNTTQTNSFPRIYDRGASLIHFTQDPADTDVYFNVNVSGGTRQVAVSTGANVPAANAWNHYVGTYDGQNQILYINGVEAANTNHGSVASPSIVSADLYIGDNGTGGGRIMDGRIGEFKRYNKTLSSTEVSQNFNATRSKYGV